LGRLTRAVSRQELSAVRLRIRIFSEELPQLAETPPASPSYVPFGSMGSGGNENSSNNAGYVPFPG